MQSTRKTIEIPEKEDTLVSHFGRSSTRGRNLLTAKEMNNRSGARPVAANLNMTAKDMSVSDILAGSRSERVRRMSQVPQANLNNNPADEKVRKYLESQKDQTIQPSFKSRSQSAAIALFEQDENNFIAEIPANFQASSPPTCLTPGNDMKGNNDQKLKYTDSAKIPIELDDFGGGGYLLKR